MRTTAYVGTLFCVTKRIDSRAVNVNLSLYPHELEALDEMARSTQRTRSDVVRHLLARSRGVQGKVEGVTAEMTVADDVPCPHPRDKIAKLPNGVWRCQCGMASNAGKNWMRP